MAPPRGFWIIVAGATPTAFRSRHRDDLVPTLKQLQRTQRDVTMRWFDGKRTWQSPDEAQAALAARRKATSGRTRDWRPGGAHKDPRARFKLTRDQKRARFKRRRPAPGPKRKP